MACWTMPQTAQMARRHHQDRDQPVALALAERAAPRDEGHGHGLEGDLHADRPPGTESTRRSEAIPSRASPTRPAAHPGHARPGVGSGQARVGRPARPRASGRPSPRPSSRSIRAGRCGMRRPSKGKAGREEQQAPLGPLEHDDRDEDREHRHQGGERQSESDDHDDRGVGGDHGRRDPQPVHAGATIGPALTARHSADYAPRRWISGSTSGSSGADASRSCCSAS